MIAAVAPLIHSVSASPPLTGSRLPYWAVDIVREDTANALVVE